MKALLLAPMGSVHRRFNRANIFALREMGYSVDLCANFENGEGPEIHNQKFVEECNASGIVTYSIPFARHSLSGSLRCLPALKELLRQGEYDIVHTHTETGGLLLRLASGDKGSSRFVYTPHGMSFWQSSSLKSQLVYRPLEKWICSGMDMNIGINGEEMETLLRWNDKNACYVHGVGLDLGRFSCPSINGKSIRDEFGIGEEDILIVSVGELDNNKNHATVIKALACLIRHNFKYVVCGVGPNKEKLQKLADSVGLSDKVRLAGYRSDIPEILNAADVFVFPSHHEGMPVSALEAMACGLPIVCSRIRGNVDIVEDGDNGFLFDPDDVDALAKEIDKLIDNKELRYSMGQKNKEFVKSFSLESVKKELNRLYGGVCKKII